MNRSAAVLLLVGMLGGPAAANGAAFVLPPSCASVTVARDGTTPIAVLRKRVQA